MFPIRGQAVTLANSIIGVGILAMPFCFERCGIVLAILLLLLSGLMSRLASHLLMRSAIKTRRRNFEFLAFQIFGNVGKFMVEIGTIGFLMGTCVAYFVVVGDLGPQIVAKIFNIEQNDTLRTAVMIVVSVVCVLPLGLLKDVESMSNLCAVTIGFYFCLVLKVIAEAGSEIFKREWMYKVEYWQPNGILRCLPIFSMSLFCQTQLFEIYETIHAPTVEKMNFVTKSAVNICSVVYVLVGFFGYVAFCNQHISGNILTNFTPSITSDVIKLGFVMSLAFSFPLIIFPCRASLYSLLYKKGHVSSHDILSNMIPDNSFKYITVGIIAVSLLIGWMLPNIELVLGFIGSTIGVMICVIFPAACFICITIKSTNERMVAQVVLAFGIIIMVLGTYANLQAAEIDNIHFEYKLINSAEMRKNVYVGDKMSKTFFPPLNEEVKVVNLQNVDNSNQKSEDKDSRLEPPNPVPPVEDLASVKKHKETTSKTSIDNEINSIDKNKFKPPDADIQIDMVANRESQIESHKNQGNKLKENEVLKDTKESRLKETNLNAELKAEEKKTKDLIDTIKRHEEEQRQIMKEQKEILKEMKKTKKEIEKDNLVKKVDAIGQTSAENKKIALESIQKLAKLAIESLGGQLDIPSEVPHKEMDMSDKLIKNPVDVPKGPILPTEIGKKLQETIINASKSQINATKEKISPSPTKINEPSPVASSHDKIEPKKIFNEANNDGLVGGKRDILQVVVRNETV